MSGRRVLFICNVDWFVLMHWRDLLADMVGRGHSVTVMCADTGRIGEIEAIGVEVEALPMSRAGTSPLAELRSLSRIIRGVRRVRPELVHTVTIKPNLYGTLAVRLATRRTPVVCAVTGFGFLLDAEASGPLSRVIRGVLRVVFRSSRVHVQVENREALQQVIDRGLATRSRTHLIEGAGVDTERFRPRSVDEGPSGPVTVLLPSRMLRDKGVVEFVEAARILGQRSDIRFLLAGRLDIDGNPTALTEAELDELLEGTGVTWLGEVDDLDRLLREVEIVVLPSYHEGLPKALLEAAASGLPLIASDIAGCRPVVVPGQNGLLVPPRDAGALAAVVESLATDAELRARFGARSRRLAIERFDRRIILEGFATLHDRVVAQ
ncbi:MAG: glycosyltransferase family 4 protein [Ilumatobacteraceae bacterium]